MVKGFVFSRELVCGQKESKSSCQAVTVLCLGGPPQTSQDVVGTGGYKVSLTGAKVTASLEPVVSAFSRERRGELGLGLLFCRVPSLSIEEGEQEQEGELSLDAKLCPSAHPQLSVHVGGPRKW